MSESALGNKQEEGIAPLIIRRFFKHRLAGIAIAVLAVLVIASAFAFLSRYNPTDQEPTNSFQKSDAAHWFGTDELGRDIFTRILYGGRVSLTVGLLSTFLSIALGVVVGALSGYFGSWTDSVLMRITDAFLTFPTIFVLILLGAFLREQQVPWLKNSVLVVIIIIAALSWMWPARLVRGLFLVLREREFVTATRALGGSYLGFGVQPPTPTWGSILATAQNQVFRAPWIAFYPGLMIFITVMAINYIGDGLRDAFDPYVIHTEK
jgi:peptide/nickel transport system permease protein